MPLHFIVRFQPRPGCEKEFREELLRVRAESRSEAGCIAIHVFESQRKPFEFAIHSEWGDDDAFELHVALPHTVRFLKAAERLLTHELKGLRSRLIGGGAGAGAG